MASSHHAGHSAYLYMWFLRRHTGLVLAISKCWPPDRPPSSPLSSQSQCTDSLRQAEISGGGPGSTDSSSCIVLPGRVLSDVGEDGEGCLTSIDTGDVTYILETYFAMRQFGMLSSLLLFSRASVTESLSRAALIVIPTSNERYMVEVWRSVHQPLNMHFLVLNTAPVVHVMPAAPSDADMCDAAPIKIGVLTRAKSGVRARTSSFSHFSSRGCSVLDRTLAYRRLRPLPDSESGAVDLSKIDTMPRLVCISTHVSVVASQWRGRPSMPSHKQIQKHDKSYQNVLLPHGANGGRMHISSSLSSPAAYSPPRPLAIHLREACL
ncbi:hypothetical protein R3P38DRAFT_3295166 [Favolaschia claudopus]|uniref:Uncharacterized protein n=1 Tax=Favolaschia claudopus TaxID=2862362 RepID=A0AAV9ZBN0_9AGAR